MVEEGMPAESRWCSCWQEVKTSRSSKLHRHTQRWRVGAGARGGGGRRLVCVCVCVCVCSLLGSEAAVPAAVFSSALIGYLRSAEIESRRVQCAG